MHHRRVHGEPLTHEAKTLDGLGHVLGAVHHRHGVDGRGRHLREQGAVNFKGLGVLHQGARIGQAAIGRLDGRAVLIVGEIVALPGEEGRHHINPLPQRQSIAGEGQVHQQGAAVQIGILLGEVYLAVPHHGPEIGLQGRVALVIAPGLELAVVDVLRRQGRLQDLSRRHDRLKFRLGQRRGIRRHLGFAVLELGCHGKIGHVAKGCPLPDRTRQGVILRLRRLQQGLAQGQQIAGQVLLLGAVQKETEIEVVGVHHGIHRHKVRHLEIAVFLVALEKLALVAGLDKELILRQERLVAVGEVELIEVFHVGQIRRHLVGRHRSLYRLADSFRL